MPADADEVCFLRVKQKLSVPGQTDAIDPLRKSSALTASPINLRMVPLPLYMPDDYLRSIEPLIAIVLGCMRWKSAQAYEVRR
jgi:hypothetical protein